MVSVSSLVWAQHQFNVDDVSAHMGYRGYSNYQASQSSKDSVYQGDARYNGADHFSNLSPYQAEFDLSPVLPNELGDVRPDIVKKDDATRLELFYRKRTNKDDLAQFGYDFFFDQSNDYVGQDTRSVGAMDGGYIIQSGDEISVSLNPVNTPMEVYKVGVGGGVVIPGLGTISVAGLSLERARDEMAQKARDLGYFGNPRLDVVAIHNIDVMVMGHVKRPGVVSLHGGQTVLDALNMVGGIKKTGSLRSVQRIRNDAIEWIDLYDMMVFSRVGQQGVLRAGDKIIVPSIGPTFAVTGDVKQPSIFEIKRQDGKAVPLSMAKGMVMAGGIIGGGDYHMSLRMGDGRVREVLPASRQLIEDGSILEVTRAEDREINGVELKGHSRKNGYYDVSAVNTLSGLLRNGKVFGDDIYPLMGVISRRDAKSFTRNYIDFSPIDIIHGGKDMALQKGDVVHLFSFDDILDVIYKNNKNKKKNNLFNPLNEFILSNTVDVEGGVVRGGLVPVSGRVSVSDVVGVVGGFTESGDMSSIEIISGDTPNGARYQVNGVVDDLSKTIVSAGDKIRVADKFKAIIDEKITISGEVKYPGTYDLMRGDTLSSLIDRAGGLTSQAYPEGAVFSRQSERDREESRFRAAAKELEQTVSVNLNAMDKDANLTPAQISMARDLAQELKSVEGLGRVTVEVDPEVLAVRPELDVLLSHGDRLHIPRRNLTVRVAGEVMHPAALLFDKEKSVGDYLMQAGGVSFYADKSRSFVVYPDGSAQPLSKGWGVMSENAMIVPGSTIIVPRDPKPFDFMDSFKDITQILSNMAITGVFIEDIANDEN